MIRAKEVSIVNLAVISGLILTSCALAVSALSAQESPKTDQAKIEWQPAPYFESADGAFSLKLRGRVHWDVAWIDDEDGAVDINSSEFRTARLGIEGRTLREFRYRLEFDFAGGEVNLKDGWIEFAVGPAEIKIGQYKLATSLEEATSSQYVTFMERASFTDAFGFARQIGVSVKTAGKNWQFQIGAFRGAASDEEIFWEMPLR